MSKTATTPARSRGVTAAQVAARAGVSRATVGYVLNQTPGQTISETTVQRVRAAAEAMGYRPNAAAQSLARGSSRLVMLVLPDWPQQGMRNYIAEAGRVLDDAGYALVTYTPHAHGRTRPLWDILRPDVVFSVAPLASDQVASIEASGVSHLIAGSSWLPDHPGFQGPRIQVDHLHALGHRSLAVATTTDPGLSELAQQRVDRAVQRAHELGLETPRVLRAGQTPETLSDGLRELIAAGVSGVIAYNDDIAAEVIGRALRLGLRIPDDLSVIGHDDAPIAALFYPAMSTVRTDDAGLGQLVADIVLAEMAGVGTPDKSITSFRGFEDLVIRESTSTPRPPR